MDRIFHPYYDWEEWAAGLWKRKPCDGDVEAAIEFMDDVDSWGVSMGEVAMSWVKSSEHNLSHDAHNRVAWIGQAACCLAIGVPSVATREAWWLLSDEKKDKANKLASEVIKRWEECQK